MRNGMFQVIYLVGVFGTTENEGRDDAVCRLKEPFPDDGMARQGVEEFICLSQLGHVKALRGQYRLTCLSRKTSSTVRYLSKWSTRTSLGSESMDFGDTAKRTTFAGKCGLIVIAQTEAQGRPFMPRQMATLSDHQGHLSGHCTLLRHAEMVASS